MFHVREIFPTFQGEGSRTGQPAVFVRLTGCNLWNGLESGRAFGHGDCSRWCDTDFVKGDPYDPVALVEAIASVASDAGMARPLVVLTGGEPMLQLAKQDQATELVSSMRHRGWEVALETNGTRQIPNWLRPLLSHVTVSPKGQRDPDGKSVEMVSHLFPTFADDLKIVVPCPMPIAALLAMYPAGRIYFQPCDTGDRGEAAMAEAFRLACQHGGRVSVQTHKFAGMP